MSADAFVVYYGLRWEVGYEDREQLDRLDERRDSRQIAARAHKLKCWWGGTADERVFVVLVGAEVGQFGWEGRAYLRLTDVETAGVVAATRERLSAAGFAEEPAWHFQFVGDR